MKINYEQALRDHSYLWSIAPAQDMTGGYVDQLDLDALLRRPTKATARRCLCKQIDYWFQVGPETEGASYQGGQNELNRLLDSDSTVREIAERHGCI